MANKSTSQTHCPNCGGESTMSLVTCKKCWAPFSADGSGEHEKVPKPRFREHLLKTKKELEKQLEAINILLEVEE